LLAIDQKQYLVFVFGLSDGVSQFRHARHRFTIHFDDEITGLQACHRSDTAAINTSDEDALGVF